MQPSTTPAPHTDASIPRHIVLLGLPGAGKGTQAEWLASITGATHISTGDLVRAEIAADTPLGQTLRQYSDRGELVPDETIIDLVRPHLAATSSWILDGFPRDLAQAFALDAALLDLGQHVDRAIVLELPDAAVVERMQDRRVSAATHKIYNLRTEPPPPDDPGPFLQRPDDHPDEIRRRLTIYHAETEPLLAEYRRRGILREVDATGSIQSVHDRVRFALANCAP
jgi:adenylate kinase